MSRPLRIDYPNTFYHVLSRGNEKHTIFEDAKDYEKFLDLFRLLRERYGVRTWSFVLMDNHYHAIVKTSEANLSRAMQWLGLCYSGYFNHRHERSGHLFQGRFKSFVVEEESYLRRLILYVHRNPLRAHLVERLADYPWSSYLCLAYGRKCVPWLERAEVLRLFRDDPKQFRLEVKDYAQEEQSLLEDLRHGLLLGGEQAVAAVREKLECTGGREQPQGRRLLRSPGLEESLRALQEALGLDEDQLQALRRPVRGRERPLRDLLIFLVWRTTDYPVSEIGAYFRVGYSCVPNARKRGEAYLKQSTAARSALKRAGIEIGC